MSSKHTFIFGGTKGIGRVYAHTLLQRNQRVTVFGRSGPDAAIAGSENYRYVACDLLQNASAIEAVRQIVATAPPNYAVFFQRFRGSENAWAGELQASLTATKEIIEVLAPTFAEDAERAIVLVSSIAGQFVAPDQPVGYHVAKAGMFQLARYFAVNLGPHGIRVNVVSPAATVKPESAAFYDAKTDLQALYRKICPLGRLGRAEDVTGVIDFLCSPAAAFVTGQNISVDGGISLQSHETLSRRLAQI